MATVRFRRVSRARDTSTVVEGDATCSAAAFEKHRIELAVDGKQLVDILS